MKKNISLFVSLMLLSSVAYSSAIVSQFGKEDNSQSSIIYSSGESYSSIVSTSSNNQSSIYTPARRTGTTTNNNTIGRKNVKQAPKDLLRQFEENTKDLAAGLKALKFCVDNSKFKDAADILFIFSEHPQRIHMLLNQDKDYIQSLNQTMTEKAKSSKNNADYNAMLAPLTVILKTDQQQAMAFGKTASASELSKSRVFMSESDKHQAMTYARNAYDANPDKYRTFLAKMDILYGEYTEANDLVNTQLQKEPYNAEALYLNIKLLNPNDTTAQKQIITNCKYLMKYPKYRPEILPMLYDALVASRASDEEIIRTFFPNENKLSVADGYVKLVDLFLSYWNKECVDKITARAEEIVTNKAALYLNLAESCVKINRLEAAKGYLKQAKGFINSDEDMSRFNVLSSIVGGDGGVKGAEILTANGRYDDAVKVYKTGGNPESLESLLGLAQTYASAGNLAASLNALNIAMSKYPDNSMVYAAFAVHFSKAGDMETARKYINQALRLDPRNPQIVELANQLKGQKTEDLLEAAFNAFDAQNYEETIAILDRITKLDPNNYTAYYYKGLTYGNLNNFNAAITEFLRAKSLNPNFVLVNYLLGVAYENLGDKQEAKKYYSIYLSQEQNVTNENAEYVNYAKSRIDKL